MANNDKFKLDAAHARLQSWLHPIQNHVVINIEDWHSMTVDRGNGDEEEVDYGSAVIMLDKQRAIKLKNKLDDFIKIMSE